ncbi:hypothetical protein ACOMHN_005417 [Nucella lapillus]
MTPDIVMEQVIHHDTCIVMEQLWNPLPDDAIHDWSFCRTSRHPRLVLLPHLTPSTTGPSAAPHAIHDWSFCCTSRHPRLVLLLHLTPSTTGPSAAPHAIHDWSFCRTSRHTRLVLLPHLTSPVTAAGVNKVAGLVRAGVNKVAGLVRAGVNKVAGLAVLPLLGDDVRRLLCHGVRPVPAHCTETSSAPARPLQSTSEVLTLLLSSHFSL